MQLLSTRKPALRGSFAEAVQNNVPGDGGLYMPAGRPPFPDADRLLACPGENARPRSCTDCWRRNSRPKSSPSSRQPPSTFPCRSFGWHLTSSRSSSSTGVFLPTAHPAKVETDLDTTRPLPKTLAEAAARPLLSEPLAVDPAELRRKLEDWPQDA